MSERKKWVDQYSALQEAEGWTTHRAFTKGWDYSDDAYDIFPRYRLVEALLIEVERLVFDADLSVNKARISLLEAAAISFLSLSTEFANKKIAMQALDSQHREFVRYVREVDSIDLALIAPLPFRRVLTAAQSDQIWQTLQLRWQIRGRGYGWCPLTDDFLPGGALTFHFELWHARKGDDLLRRFFADEGIGRCFMVNEVDPVDYEVGIELVDASYKGTELFLTTNGNWVLYASHESSITIAGTLADFISREWPDARGLSYGGPYHTNDLRGSWNY